MYHLEYHEPESQKCAAEIQLQFLNTQVLLKLFCVAAKVEER